MKAVILAGGRGTRGRPYTEYFPKAMIPVRGRPLIDHVVGHLRSFDFVGEISIIADFAGLGGQIRSYYGRERGIRYVQDSQSGTGGDLLHARNLGGRFVLWFVDNLCAVDLGAMRGAFLAGGGTACIATRRRRREETGFAEVRDGMVRRFTEKPVLDLPMSECLGVYMLGGGVLDRVRGIGGGHVNLSYDVLQPLASEGVVSAFDIGREPWMDVESPVVLERNGDMARRITGRMGRRGPTRGARSRPRALAS
ncbi:MAG: nucleotidyltransferase family protein [Nitrosopumilus sp.]|nr:nucleotidyltransferase family protein [Nitrosopumilus sp.]